MFDTIFSIYFLQNVMKMGIDGSYKSEIVDLDRQENIAQLPEIEMGLAPDPGIVTWSTPTKSLNHQSQMETNLRSINLNKLSHVIKNGHRQKRH